MGELRVESRGDKVGLRLRGQLGRGGNFQNAPDGLKPSSVACFKVTA